MRKLRVLFMGIVGGVIIAAMLTLMLPVKITYVLSDSMSPTLMTGDMVLISEHETLSYESVIAFFKAFASEGEGQNLFLVKRILGISGDHIYGDGEFWYRNDKPMGSCQTKFSYVVPENNFFVVGDNANGSYDSREWEEPFVPVEHVVGVVTRIISPWEKFWKGVK